MSTKEETKTTTMVITKTKVIPLSILITRIAKTIKVSRTDRTTTRTTLTTTIATTIIQTI